MYILYNVYLASLSRPGPIWTHLCQQLADEEASGQLGLDEQEVVDARQGVLDLGRVAHLGKAMLEPRTSSRMWSMIFLHSSSPCCRSSVRSGRRSAPLGLSDRDVTAATAASRWRRRFGVHRWRERWQLNPK